MEINVDGKKYEMNIDKFGLNEQERFVLTGFIEDGNADEFFQSGINRGHYLIENHRFLTSAREKADEEIEECWQEFKKAEGIGKVLSGAVNVMIAELVGMVIDEAIESANDYFKYNSFYICSPGEGTRAVSTLEGFEQVVKENETAK